MPGGQLEQLETMNPTERVPRLDVLTDLEQTLALTDRLPYISTVVEVTSPLDVFTENLSGFINRGSKRVLRLRRVGLTAGADLLKGIVTHLGTLVKGT